MKIKEIKKILREHKQELENQYHVSKLGIFGSYVRNEQHDNSDVDILVEFSKPISLLDFISMEQKISKFLKLKVDLVSRKALKPFISKYILKEVQLI